jgi:predicted ATPase
MGKIGNITGITLAGFQVFEEPTFIPMDRLTLLFGPNSAGKSSVQDALELYQLTLDDKSTYEDVQKVLKRHWRRSSKTSDGLAEKVHISVMHSVTDELGLLAAVSVGRRREIQQGLWQELRTRPKNYRSQFEFVLDPDNIKGELDFTIQYQLFNGEELLVGNVDNGMCVNIAHPLLSTSAEIFSIAAQRFPDQVSLRNGLLTTKNGMTDFQPSGVNFDDRRENWLGLNLSERYKQESAWHRPELQHVVQETSLLVGALLSSFHSESKFTSNKVDASRKVPTRKDLTFELEGWDDQLQQFGDQGDPQYRSLATSLASEFFAETAESKVFNVKTRRAYSEHINRSLSDHLFLEQGYRLDFDFRVLLNKSNSKAAVSGKSLDKTEFGYLVEVYLRDSIGRKHAVEDVGSGIGYILPVLCSLFDDAKVSPDTFLRAPIGVQKSTGFIQQPELHLHPALQAALGDIFLESSSLGKQVLIETHSEHLLLRLLKRIRQTHLQVEIAPELKLKAGDLCVLYFDPSTDGTTKVKRLRISEDGEFMDRWPRGFFGERDMELFDE